MQQNLSRASDGVAKLSRTDSYPRFNANERVFHQKFGYGQVQVANEKYVRVAFETGIKSVRAEFLQPA